MLTVRAAGDAFDGRRVAADQGVGGIVGLHGFDESAAAARVADVPESNIEGALVLIRPCIDTSNKHIKIHVRINSTFKMIHVFSYCCLEIT
jgi:hypothetical protein